MRLAITLLALSAGLLVPQVAAADSGSITNVHAIGGGQVEATYTSSSTYCTSYDYCGWYPYAVQQAESDGVCRPYASGDGRLTYVGSLQDDSTPQTATDTFYASHDPVRICLYVSQADDREVLVAEAAFGTSDPSPPPASSPTPAPPATAPAAGSEVAPLTIAEGRSLVSGVLRKRYGRRYARSTLKRACYRLTREKVRCRVSWRKRPYKYSGNVTMRNDPDDPVNSFIYNVAIKRKRIHRRPAPTRQPSRPSPARPPAPPSSSCDPNYGGCLDPNAYDYDCAGGSGDGPRYTGPVRVIGNDHYDLDRDADGVGCDE